MTSKLITLTVDSRGIATLTLQRPEKRNAFDAQFITDFQAALNTLQTDATVRVVILAAAGKIFCAGADIAWLQHLTNSSAEENLADAKKLAGLFHTLYTLNKPVIALAQGAALGGGIGLIACCDIVLITPETYFAFKEVKIGMIPATIAPYIGAAIGPRWARHYFTTGEQFDAPQALHIGLAHKVVAEEKLAQAGYAIAHQLLDNAPLAMSMAKNLVQDCHPLQPKISEKTAGLFAKACASEEAKEGMGAFLAKRQPHWKNNK